MNKRTDYQVKKDLNQIKQAVVGNGAKSIKEISQITGISYYLINKTLSIHPRVGTWIKEQMLANAKKVVENLEQNDLRKEKEVSVKKYVIDTSIIGDAQFQEKIDTILKDSEAILILTSLMLEEFDKFQNQEKFLIKAIDAIKLLNFALRNPKKVQVIPIVQSFEIPDETLLQFCKQDPNIILLTSNKKMALKAKMSGINVEYSNYQERIENHQFRTLFDARYSSKGLKIDLTPTNIRSYAIFSNGIKYETGIKKLKIGDEVFIAKMHKDYITFSHFKVISLESSNNVLLINAFRIYHKEKEKRLAKIKPSSYKSFIKDFYARFRK